MRINSDTRGKGFYDIFPKQDGQTDISFSYPGAIRAFHCHKIKTEWFFCAGGVIELVLTDPFEKIYMEKGDMVEITPGRWHGFRILGDELGVMLEYSSHKFDLKDPDDLRKPFNEFHNWEIEKK